jgi:hypothetical protein
MVKVSNFSSVLEIAFTLNVLLYLFEVLPAIRNGLMERAKKIEELRKRKIEVTKNREVYPIFFLVGSMLSGYHLILKYLSLFFSCISLAILVFVGFYPETVIWGWLMFVGLFFLLFTTPTLAFAVNWVLNKHFDVAEDSLREEINKAQDREIEEILKKRRETTKKVSE